MQTALKVMGVGAAGLVQKAQAQLSPPDQYQLTLDNNMPVVSTMFQTQTINQMNIETHDKYSIVFDTTCMQSLQAATLRTCADEPTYVNDALDASQLTGVGSEFSGKESAGFTTSGRLVYGDYAVKWANGTYAPSYTSFMFTVMNITDDGWNWN